MKAIRIREPGDPDVLELVERGDLEPGPGEALVRVRAAGLNRADLLQRRGLYPAPAGSPPDIPGLEFAGELVAVGPDAGRPGEARARRALKIGAHVMGICGGGGYAEQVVVPVEHLMLTPPGLDPVASGAIPEVFLTACDALFTRGRLEQGERVLIHSAGGGVGTAAVQLARLAGAVGVAGTASAPKLERLDERGLPLDLAIDYRLGGFAEAVREWTAGRGIDVIIDTVGAPYFAENVASLAPLGRIVLVGVMGGSRTEVDLRALMAKRATVVGTVLRARSIEQKAEATRRFAERFLAAFARRPPGLEPMVDRTFVLSDAAEAHRYLESNRAFGKVILEV